MKKITRKKAFYVIIFFVSMWLINALLFYYSEHIVAGRKDIDIYAALYWSIITMATIGYGDITPVRGLGWIVAGFAAIMGIIAYTLTISVIADWFLSLSIRRSLGMAPLKNKKILVIGNSDSCNEIIDELILNGYREEIGYLVSEQPNKPLDIDYLVGDPSNEETLVKAGIKNIEHVYLCISDDSKALHTTLLIKNINPKTRIYAIVSNTKTEELLREAGAQHTVSTRLLGRTIASALFEPGVLTILTDIVSARGKGDLIEIKPDKNHIGKTIEKIEQELNKKDKKHTYRIIAIIKPNKTYTIAPPPKTKIQPNTTLIAIKGKQ